MRKILHPKLIEGRVRHGSFATDDSYGTTGAFMVRGPTGAMMRIIASDATDPESEGWEHVSVSLRNRCPNWPEMCFVKELFWADDEVVFQLHPAKSEYVNNHPYVLHLWRNVKQDPPLPPSILVGIKGEEYKTREEAKAGWQRAVARGEIKG